MSHDKTVLVVGGGPAGSTAAALLARAGLRVRLFERAIFPRYHIGESLAPSCRAVLELSGAEGKVAAHGFQLKWGGLFRWGAEDWAVGWEANLGPQVYSWQVERSEFDQLLLDNARDQGVEVVEGAAVKCALFEGDRATGVEWTPPHVTTSTVATGDFVVDASGRNALFATRHYRDRRPHDVFRNVAIWGYWDGGTTLPGTPEGGLDAVSAPDGWYWVIPLADNRFSVGYVTHRDNFLARRPAYKTLEHMLRGMVEESDAVRGLVEHGQLLSPVRCDQDWSYTTGRFAGPGHIMVGDAACFLDPLLSTGTHLAMFSALIGAAAIIAALDEVVGEEEALQFFERQYRRAYQRLLKLVSLMYQQYRGKETYFWLAQRLVRDGMRYRLPIGPFSRIISGLSDLQDAGYSPSWVGPNRKSSVAEPGSVGNVVRGLQDSGTGLRLVTAPRIGLERVGSPVPPTLSTR